MGDAGSENVYRERADRIPLSLPQRLPIEQAIVLIASQSRPRDDKRAATAVLMTELAVAFCLYHELAHIVLGHVAANRVSPARTALLEVASRRMVEGLGRSRLALRRVWEYEADLVAANMLLQDMMDARAESAFKDALGADNDCGPLARYQCMLGAVFVTFLLFAQAPSTATTHPDPLVRFAAIANDSVAAIAEQQPQLQLDFEAITEAVDDVARSTLLSWKVLGLSTNATSPIRNLLTAQGRVERLEAQRRALHVAHSRHAHFYPFRD